MNNETWTDWLIQCDMLQDITSFSALGYVYVSALSNTNAILYITRSNNLSRRNKRANHSLSRTKTTTFALSHNTLSTLSFTCSKNRARSKNQITSRSHNLIGSRTSKRSPNA